MSQFTTMQKNNNYQIITILLGLLCLTLVAFAPPADSPPEICRGGENILPNCNFSAGLQGWVPYFEEGGADVTVLQGGGECHAPDCPAAYLVTTDYFVGGIYQQVSVAPGNTYQANVVWLVLDSLSNDSGIRAQVGPIGRKLGIDPTGGTDPRSPNVIWGPENERRDCKICDGQEVTATAQADVITLFVRIDDRWKLRAKEKGFDLPPSKDQFWIDDVGMRQVSGDNVPQPAPTDTPEPAPVPTDTPEPAPTDTPEPAPTDTPDMQTQAEEEIDESEVASSDEATGEEEISADEATGKEEVSADEATEIDADMAETDTISDTEISELSAVNTSPIATPTPSTEETESEAESDETTHQADEAEFQADENETESDSEADASTDSNEETGDNSTETATELPTIAATEAPDRLPTLTPSATPSPTNTPDATAVAKRVEPIADAPSSDRQSAPTQTEAEAETSWLATTGPLLCLSGLFLMATAMFLMGLVWLYRLSQNT
ncbi:hypothetical protein QUF63_01380 [Anaerolineales bacterium HSG25]|nr:hypothetical protein [Anaerolineales bacterium HSG25]